MSREDKRTLRAVTCLGLARAALIDAATHANECGREDSALLAEDIVAVRRDVEAIMVALGNGRGRGA